MKKTFFYSIIWTKSHTFQCSRVYKCYAYITNTHKYIQSEKLANKEQNESIHSKSRKEKTLLIPQRGWLTLSAWICTWGTLNLFSHELKYINMFYVIKKALFLVAIFLSDWDSGSQILKWAFTIVCPKKKLKVEANQSKDQQLCTGYHTAQNKLIFVI